MNNYPADFIDLYIQKRLQLYSKKSQPLKNQNTTQNSEGFLVFPFSKQITVKLSRLLKKIKYNVISTITNTFGKKIFKSTKDKIEKDERSDLIYSINCQDCSSIYIGQTGQYLKNRIYQHKYSIKKLKEQEEERKEKGNKQSPPRGNTALTKHAIKNQHEFDFDGTKIKGFEKNPHKRSILEMFFIKKFNKTAVNFMTDTLKFPGAYNYLAHRQKM